MVSNTLTYLRWTGAGMLWQYVNLPTMNRSWNAVTRHCIKYVTLPTINRSWNAVSQTSGRAAASINFMLDGRGISSSSLLATYSALPPPEHYKHLILFIWLSHNSDGSWNFRRSWGWGGVYESIHVCLLCSHNLQKQWQSFEFTLDRNRWFLCSVNIFRIFSRLSNQLLLWHFSTFI